jgi:hypothetical protein
LLGERVGNVDEYVAVSEGEPEPDTEADGDGEGNDSDSVGRVSVTSSVRNVSVGDLVVEKERVSDTVLVLVRDEDSVSAPLRVTLVDTVAVVDGVLVDATVKESVMDFETVAVVVAVAEVDAVVVLVGMTEIDSELVGDLVAVLDPDAVDVEVRVSDSESLEVADGVVVIVRDGVLETELSGVSVSE